MGNFGKYFIEKSYELLENVTPLQHFDCGKICDSKCCKGDMKDGMLLFPGEKSYFENTPDFIVYYDEKYKMYAVSCKGYCKRNQRPLSCRIFPYMLYCDKNGKVSVAPDIRASGYCEILNSGLIINSDFLRKLRMIAILAQQNEEIKDFLGKITEIITDFGNII